MLVAEDGHDAAASFEGSCDAFEESSPGVELLPLLVRGVVAVLADADHAVDDDLSGPEREGILDRRDDWDPMLGGQRSAQVALGGLVEVQGGSVRAGPGPPSSRQPSRSRP